MKIQGWKYYNHAATPTTPPHLSPNLEPVESGEIWRMDGAPYIVRYTTDFDCGQETQWWYCIKDTPYDPMLLNSNRRYKITKGKKYFDVRVIDPQEYKEDLYKITIDAYSDWPKEYRPNVNRADYMKKIDTWKEPTIIWGAFLRETDTLCGYVLLTEYPTYVTYNMMRAKPSFEKFCINAAMVASVCEHYNERLCANDGFYISDGARNILHKTQFQDYLERFFAFRKAYCKLHIYYRKPFGLLVSGLMPFRKMLYKLDCVGFISKINAILRMEEICRSQTTQNKR